MSRVSARSAFVGKAALMGSVAAVAAASYAPSAQAAYRPACLKLLNVAIKPGGVAGQVKWACPPTGAAIWRFSLDLISTPDCDFAALPTTQMGGPFTQKDPWPINRVIETRPAGKINRMNQWQVCVRVYEGSSQKPVGFECSNNIFIDTHGMTFK